VQSVGAVVLVLVLSYFLKCLDYLLIIVITAMSAVFRGNVLHLVDDFKWIGLEFVTLFVFWIVAKATLGRLAETGVLEYMNSDVGCVRERLLTGAEVA
jgi:hypothetical protein